MYKYKQNIFIYDFRIYMDFFLVEKKATKEEN